MREALAALSEKLSESQKQETVSVPTKKRSCIFNILSKIWATVCSGTQQRVLVCISEQDPFQARQDRCYIILP